jgi:hypothetical protein
LKTIKILTKRPRNKNRNQKKVDQIKIISIIIKKIKNHKLDLKGKKINKKNKAKVPNRNILFIQIRNQWLN